jgi:hypothetical protein
MVQMNPVPETPARFDARKLVLVPPPLVCAKDEMSMVLFLFPLKAKVHEVVAFCSSATCVQSPCRSTEVLSFGLVFTFCYNLRVLRTFNHVH